MSRINKKHIVIFNNNGVVCATTAKDWARGHRELFPKFSFDDSDTTPRVDEIGKYLVGKLMFDSVSDEKVVFYYEYKGI